VSTCPKCQKELDFFEYQGIELLKCSDCNGFWFKSEKFREAKQVGFSGLSGISSSELPSEESPPPSSSKEEMRCPDCEVPLIPYAYAYSSEIQLYRCRDCQGIWANYADLVRIEELLTGYKESLDEAKAMALPLMLKVKKQIQQEERAREEEQKRSKKGFFNRIFRQKDSQNRKVQNIFDDHDSNDDKFS
jgi:Zn-finger nucleic acid-binding protein